MNEPEGRCQTCGALLVDARRVNYAATGTAIPGWQCEQQHRWLQSMVHGWVPIDPGAIVEEEATTVRTSQPATDSRRLSSALLVSDPGLSARP
jgi:hypothetical protein